MLEEKLGDEVSENIEKVEVKTKTSNIHSVTAAIKD